MKKLLIFIFILISSFSYSQCFCSDIKFKLKLKDDVSYYSIKTIYAPDLALIKDWRKFDEHESKDRIINFQFETQGGIDSLEFVIRNNKTNEDMKVTVLNMTYDNPYFIDMISFTKGEYLFDWKEIIECQKKFETRVLVKCKQMKFYQLQLKSDKELKERKNNFTHNKIKLFSLKCFKQRREL